MSLLLRRRALSIPQVSLLDGSMQFDADGENMEIASFSSSSPNRRTFTISKWVWQDSEGSEFSGLNVPLCSDGPFENYFSDAFFIDPSGAWGVSAFLNASEFPIEVYDFNGFLFDQWAHYVCRVDTTQATAADRVRLYRNGAQITALDVEEYPDQNFETQMFVNGNLMQVTFNTDEVSKVMRVADWCVVEGQSLAPTAFGYDNGGTWSWKDYAGSFGTHGFRLNPTGSGDLGQDKSGNGIDFTNSGVTFSSEKPPE